MLPQARTIRTIGFLAVLNLTGCSIWPFGTYQDPDVQLVRVEVVKAKILQQDFKLHLRVDNPGDSRLLVRGLRYRVLLNDMLLAEGESTDWFIVGANSQKNVVIPVRTNLWEHLKDIAKLLRKPDEPIHYRLEGKLKTGFLFGHSVHLARDGEIHMRK